MASIELNLVNPEEISATFTCSLGKCDGSGWIPVTGPDGYRAMRPCLCRVQGIRRARLERLFRESGIPKRYQGKLIVNSDPKLQPKAHEVAVRYIENWEANQKAGLGLMFMGPVGTGKSHYGYAILQELVKRGVTAYGQTVPDLLDELRPHKDDDTHVKLGLLKTIDFLMLDDLGCERNTEWAVETLYKLVNARNSNCLPTIYTTNLTLEEMERDRDWKRIVDRILEMCDAVRLEGPSQRVRMAKERRER